MCGSNAAGEAMPPHIMFSSDAKEAENYAVNAVWILSLPRVKGIFGHEEEKVFPASVTTNDKGGDGWPSSLAAVALLCETPLS